MKQFKGRPVVPGKALCLPMTIGSTTGGMVLYAAACMGRQPACLLFSQPIDSLAAAGAILAGVWSENPMPMVDSLGEEFFAGGENRRSHHRGRGRYRDRRLMLRHCQ